MATNPVAWFEIYIQEMQRATQFYEAVLGVKLEPLPVPEPDLEMMAFPMAMEKTGAGGALVKMSGVASGGNSTLVYFSCDDCAVEESRIVPAGGKIFRSKVSIGEYGFMVLAHDPEGNMFGLHSLK
jgi:uncharacterized protein